MDQSVDKIFREEYVKILAILTHKYSHQSIDLIEDALQDTFVKALKIWPNEKPQNSRAWILKVASNHILDELKSSRVSKRSDQSAFDYLIQESDTVNHDHNIADDQLKMIFACCHPGLSNSNQLLLSLKFLCGFGNKEIARALLKKPDAIEKAFTRAKVKFKSAVSNLDIPDIDELPSRLSNVLHVIYLQFTEGYKVSAGNHLLNKDLCIDAIKLAEHLLSYPYLCTPETHALLSLMNFQISRFDSRLNAKNEIVILKNQDRSLWDYAAINKGVEYLELSSTGMILYNFHLEAMIAREHCCSPKYENTDWEQIINLYGILINRTKNPIHILNQIIAFKQIHSNNEVIELIQQNEALLPNTNFRWILEGDVHSEGGDFKNAQLAYEKALALTKNEVERQFIELKTNSLTTDEL